jgi:hypothetical protein
MSKKCVDRQTQEKVRQLHRDRPRTNLLRKGMNQDLF